MPIAGFTVFQKERLKDVATITPPVNSSPDSPASPQTTKTTKTPLPPLTEFTPTTRYVDKATGNIYQTFADKIDERKFSSTVIPKVYEAYFGNKGESPIMRYLKSDGRTIETFVGNLPKEFLGADTVSNSELKGSLLPEDTIDVSVSPDTLKIFYLFGVGDGVTGVVLDLLSGKKVQIFDSPFTEWLTSWPNSKIITLTTKPSGNTPGYMYMVNPDKQDLNEVLGGINGLTTLTSPNGKLILYGDSNLSLNVFSADTRTSLLLGVKTLPEKCVWVKTNSAVYCAVPKFINAGLYPDSWYQGETTFGDQIWEINTGNGEAKMLGDVVSVAREEIDGIKLALDENENYLFFVNKKNSFLWEINLK